MSDTPFIPQILTPFWQLTMAQREDVLWKYEQAAQREGEAYRAVQVAVQVARGTDAYTWRLGQYVRFLQETSAFREYLMAWRREQ